MGLRATRRLVGCTLPLLVSLLVCACSAFREAETDGGDGAVADAGGDAAPVHACTGTAMRAHQPLGSAGATSSQAALVPRAAGGALVVWEAIPGGGTPAVYWAQIETDGRVSNSKKLVDGEDPALLRLADGLRLLWREGSALKFLRLDESGEPQGSAVTLHSGVQASFAVAASSGDLLVLALNEVEPLGKQVHVMLVGADGAVTAAPAKLPQQGNNSTLAAITRAGAEFWVAWTDMREGTPAVYFTRLDKLGRRMADDQRISAAGLRGSFPSVAPQLGGGGVVCYQQKMQTDIQDIFCSRLDGAGNVTNTTRLTQSAHDSQNPQAIAHSSHTWVLWDDVYDVDEGTVIHWQFLNANGDAVLDQPRHFSDYMGWRPHGLSAADGLYFTKFRQDPVSGWKAELGVLNCF